MMVCTHLSKKEISIHSLVDGKLSPGSVTKMNTAIKQTMAGANFFNPISLRED